MAFPEDLLEQAHHLACREPKRPRQASLRRAISTAYYALFHLLIRETVQNWKHREGRHTLARMFEHNTMRRACIDRRDKLSERFKSNPPPSPELEVDRHIYLIAKTFVEMYQHRNSADYDPSATWTRSDVNAKVESVSPAFESWKKIRKEISAQKYLVTLLLKER